ncbi:MAG: hypothetical protein ACLUI0_11805 [Blautia massiliensis (ex Durand et al. 2017)]
MASSVILYQDACIALDWNNVKKVSVMILHDINQSIYFSDDSSFC